MNSLLVVFGIIEVTLRHPSGDVRLDIYVLNPIRSLRWRYSSEGCEAKGGD